jgi:hypothetical protein
LGEIDLHVEDVGQLPGPVRLLRERRGQSFHCKVANAGLVRYRKKTATDLARATTPKHPVVALVDENHR